ncbi:uncharacterized protein LOC108030580 [Drosophila biarmipes]|uniref:uncharacterized protein LOC108030580 n=1 Tax=Drosophila biarmipes TaxID=125945 RepID=UPI0007E62A30|nr:uncharacterized protein LOC108030580 [Drosophila biarmipes]
MFTNWLTGSSTAATRSASSTSGIGGAGSGAPGGVSASALVMSSPPDVILEVGPAPGSVRFVAHSLVLGMHSGYLRSAIRLDDASGASSVVPAPNLTANSSSATTATGELLLYLSNVTADQFAPLLTYMYTGYLDLTVDNIFAVLLATHVLHMPRALEICRSFLARAQTEGYLNGNPAQLCPVPGLQAAAKVIRPIPSKATMPNFGFLPMPQAQPSAHPPPPPPQPAATPASLSSFAGSTSLLDSEHATRMQDADEEDEDVEVFIDSNTATDNEADAEPDVDMDCNVSVVSSLAGSSAGSLNIERLDVKPPTPPVPIVAPPKIQSQSVQPKISSSKRETAKGGRGNKTRSRKSSGLQVAKAPVPAAQLEMASAPTPITPSKFIIDVASCDGPVRFRRILNTAYGHKPESLESGSLGGSGGGGGGAAAGGSSSAVEQHRSQQSVSYSFHQQMARAISSQQRQLSHQQQEESENSGDAIGPKPQATGATASSSSSTSASSRKAQAAGSSATSASGSGAHQELYVCVYCKHTFKSQYCYQKHAKRHLNPLSLTTADKKLLAEPTSLLASSGNPDADNQPGQRATTAAERSGAAGGAASALLRREVRPLDMNVQYYPCKTCGSKFPSYYFVHKHRKMCHADEIEATATSNTSNNSSSNTSSSSSNSNSSTSNTKRDAAAAAAAATAADDQQQHQQHS